MGAEALQMPFSAEKGGAKAIHSCQFLGVDARFAIVPVA
jgi:hypothetical protein